MGNAEIGAYVAVGIWGLIIRSSIKRLGVIRTLWLMGIIFFVAIRLMFGWVGAFRVDPSRDRSRRNQRDGC